MTTQEQKSLKSFLIIWSGQIVSLLGSSLVGFALVWYLTEQTGSARVLAMATAVAMLPQIVLGLFAGALVDRWNRRIVMITADSVSALATLVVALLYAFDVIQVWHIYVMMFIRSIAGAFHWPAMQATTPLMVPERHLARVSGLNQSLFGLAGIIAPPVGALLIAILPMEGIVGIEVVTALFAILPLCFIAVPNPVRASTATGSSYPAQSVWNMQVWFIAGGVLTLLLGALSFFMPFAIRFEEEGARVMARLHGREKVEGGLVEAANA